MSHRSIKERPNDGICHAVCYIGDDFGDNSATFRCQLEKLHSDMHEEKFQRDGRQFSMRWEGDEELLRLDRDVIYFCEKAEKLIASIGCEHVFAEEGCEKCGVYAWDIRDALYHWARYSGFESESLEENEAMWSKVVSSQEMNKIGW